MLKVLNSSKSRIFGKYSEDYSDKEKYFNFFVKIIINIKFPLKIFLYRKKLSIYSKIQIIKKKSGTKTNFLNLTLLSQHNTVVIWLLQHYSLRK